LTAPLEIPMDGAGCTAKVTSVTLDALLRSLPYIESNTTVTRVADKEDAAVITLDTTNSIVASVDYITPVTNDPYSFGQIAVSHCLSDIYAKAVLPQFGLNILGFPEDQMPLSVIQEIMRGAYEKAREVGVSIVGGHTMNFNSLFYGMACFAVTRSSSVVFNNRAKPKDVLVMTKPIGTGAVVTGLAELGIDRPSDRLVERAHKIMCATNEPGAKALRAVGASAATDISGFGLIGHLSEMLEASGVSATIYAMQVPVLDGVLDYIGPTYPFCSIQKNLVNFSSRVAFADDVDQSLSRLLFDAQTSGGLLISVPQEQLSSLCHSLTQNGALTTSIIGEIRECRASCDKPIIEVMN
jgi:selenium donor protein